MTAAWWCSRCDRPIDLTVDGEPHTDPATGDDVHDHCCASCHPRLAPGYGIQLDATTNEIRDQVACSTGTTEPIGILGHGDGLTQEQAARGERGAAA